MTTAMPGVVVCPRDLLQPHKSETYTFGREGQQGPSEGVKHYAPAYPCQRTGLPRLHYAQVGKEKASLSLCHPAVSLRKIHFHLKLKRPGNLKSISSM